jgi:transcriptional regulator of acetoin/glycerol metabolism
MRPPDETVEVSDTAELVGVAPRASRGLVLVYSAGEALLAPLTLGGEPLDLGRGAVAGIRIEDGTMSRRHARVSYERGRWRIRDLGSRNGVVVDGARVQGEVQLERPRVMRLGESVFLFYDDVRRFLGARVEASGDRLMGPTLKRVWDAIASAARSGETLHITGESGSGKELAARAFHDGGAHAGGPFIAVNCAAIPEGVAERLLFGARKGAYSGAHENSEGYAQAAHGGTLFLDEVGELDLQVQAKLLRVLESKEVLALGDSRPRRIDIRICSATHRELRTQVAEKRFREDLYFRIGLSHVEIPPLRERLEEVPFFIERELRRVDAGLRADAPFVEACLRRHWPGNVREMLAEVREAARSAAADGVTSVDVGRLAPGAGARFDTTSEPAPRSISGMPPREVIVEALRREEGRIATAARALGVHRNQLRRWLAKNQVDPRALAGQGPAADEPTDPSAETPAPPSDERD